MRKLFFIPLLLMVACTAKKKQDTVSYTEPEQDSAVAAKKYLYVDTPTADAPVVYDTATAVVQAPVEEAIEKKAEENDTIEIDTTVYRWQLAMAPDSVEEWKRMKQFAYVKYLDSLLKVEKEKKKEEAKPPSVSRGSGTSGGGWLNGVMASSGLKIFLWVLAAAFVLFIIYKLFVTEGAFKRKAKALPGKTPTAEEEVITPESDFDRLVREALQQRNYRLAVRYHYLQTLHSLAQKNYVQLAADKTNYNYVTEIKDYQKQTDFKNLTLNYEYVWYGEFAIDEIVYHKLKTAFQAFNTKI